MVLAGCGNREASYDIMMATGVGQIDNVKQAINDGANVNARVPNGTLKGYTMLDLAIVMVILRQPTSFANTAARRVKN